MPCPLCDDTGWKPVASPSQSSQPVRRVERCDCWRESVGRQRLAQAGIPKKYLHCTFDNFNAYSPLLVRARDKVREVVDCYPVVPPTLTAKGGLFLQGLPGVGKTHLAVACLAAIVRRTGAWGVFYDTRALLRQIRDSYNPAIHTTESEVLRPVMMAELLVLDDLGAEKTSEWVEETMNLIVNTRYSECRTTIFTSNFLDEATDDPDSLIFRIGFRMRSRVAEMCEFVEMDGADYRQLPPNFTDRELIALARGRGRRLPPRAGRQARAQLREPSVRDGRADLKWPGGRAGS